MQQISLQAHSMLVNLLFLIFLLNFSLLSLPVSEAHPRLPSSEPTAISSRESEPGGKSDNNNDGNNNGKFRLITPKTTNWDESSRAISSNFKEEQKHDEQVEMEKKWMAATTTTTAQPSGNRGDGDDDVAQPLGELFERLGRSDLIQSIMQMMARLADDGGRGMEKATATNGEEAEDGNENSHGRRISSVRNSEGNSREQQRIERRSAAKSNERTSTADGARGRISVVRRHFSNPPFMSPPRSPTPRQQQQMQQKVPHQQQQLQFQEMPEISASIDAMPLSVSKPSEQFARPPPPPPPKAAAENDEMTAIRDAIGKEWKHALFGRSGLLTEVFNFVNDKRKEGLAKQVAQQAAQQAAPNLANGANAPTDFTRILDQLLRKAQTGDFDEPLPEIPFIGICNRLSCADIYKALDEFRKSEFFSNFQTAISLLNDPKGFDMIGELLANPELLENFTGPESLGQMFGGGGGETKKISMKKGGGELVEIGENTDAENIGVDFSSYVDGNGAPKETSKKEGPTMPRIETSIDAGSSDYYSSAVDDKVAPSAAGLEAKTLARQIKEDKLLPLPNTQNGQNNNNKQKSGDNSGTTGSNKDRFEERPLPEIAESIDARPTMDEEDEFPDGPMTFEKNEFLPSMANANNNNNGTRKIVITPVVEVRLGRDKQQHQKQQVATVDSLNRAGGTALRKTATTTTFNQTATKMSSSTMNGENISTFGRAEKLPLTKSNTPIRTTTTTTTTTTVIPTTTRRNFRRDDDYYSMYYDDNNDADGINRQNGAKNGSAKRRSG